jgi:hypothetical protein
MKHPIGQTYNGIPVYVDLITSKAAANIAEQPHLLRLIQEVLAAVDARQESINIDHDMGRVVGYTHVVKIEGTDNIVYAKLIRDNIYTRFVKNGKPASTSHVTAVLQRDEAGEYELLDAWIGKAHPPRPGSPEETGKSKTYWEQHAYVLDRQPVQAKTITKICPY